MTVKTSDVYIFYNAEEVAEAVEKMKMAIGKKHEAAAAVKFAHAMLERWGERKTISDEAQQKRLDLLNTYHKIHAVKSQIQEAVEFASNLAGKVYDEYTAQGGDHWEAEAVCLGKTREEVIDEAYSRKPAVLISTRNKEAEEAAVNA